MKNFIKILTLSLFCMMFSIMLTGCKRKLDVGIILPTKEEERWHQDYNQFTKILSEQDFSCETIFSEGVKEDDIATVKRFIKEGAKVIVYTPRSMEYAKDICKTAKDAKVKVIAYDRLIPDTNDVDYYVSFASEQVGELQAKYLISTLSNDAKDVPLYIYTGPSSDNNSYSFFSGAWEVLQPLIANGTLKIANSTVAESFKYKNVLTRDEIEEILLNKSTDWDYNKANMLAMQDLAEPNAILGDVLILGPNDTVARGIADAFSKDERITSYKITGQDSSVESIKYIINNKQNMTIFKDTSILVTNTCSMISNILEKRDIVTNTKINNNIKDVPTLLIPVSIITKNNYKEVLIDSGYYSKKDLLN